MSNFIYNNHQWPDFQWDETIISIPLAALRFKQGKLIGRMENLGFDLQKEATLSALTEEVIKSSEIEGETLDAGQVRSSIARRLGIEVAGLVPSDRQVDCVVEMMLEATQNFQNELSEERLFGWHALLFPTGRSGARKIIVGNWRKNTKADPMQVISGPIGRETVHFQAPDSEIVRDEMLAFIQWFNEKIALDPLLKAAIAHLWFVTIHPFKDGNGRIARAIADMQLARSDQSLYRFYSMSARIRLERDVYYTTLEETQKGSLDITRWILWFLSCLEMALKESKIILARVLEKAKFREHFRSISMNERQTQMINKLLDGFEGKLTSTKWAKITKISPDTALRDIQDLIQKGVLIRIGESRKGAWYVLTPLP
ncbi:MAG: Fic family protein [Bacteroidota bacterium]|nr:Fic family protein [Bacteroidota bacterium]